MLRLMLVVGACCAIALLVACRREPAAPASDSADAAAFARQEQSWRDARLQRLTAPDGWASLIGLHWIDPGVHTVGSGPDNGIRLAMGPAHLGVLRAGADGVSFQPGNGVALTLDGAPFASPQALRTDAAEGGPSVLGFDGGKGAATVIERSGRLALRVRHADAPSRTGFAGLDYWPASAAWKVQARFVPHPPGTTIAIANIIGGVEQVPNPGALEFERNGAKYRIEALDEGEDTLFLVFADRTNGHDSYGAGRFIDAPRPDAQGRVAIDFNQAYNPPCAFTAFATCPLPPPENRLDLAVEAGEKAYRKPHA
ncbi:MAG TPA: DUF1684 domain-containing protein [Luteimonas sp.]|nr:DUF1684 domain-containing protein [Luteimonas sp.]